MNAEYKKNLLIILVAGGLAAFINLFRWQLFFEAEYIFGPMVVLLVSVYRGAVVGLLTGVIGSLTLVYAWGSFWSTLTFGLEGLIVGWVCYHKRYNLILVVITYWIFMGMPISWYSISHYDLILESHKEAVLIKQLTNGIIYAHLAVLLKNLSWFRKVLSERDFHPTLSIKQHSSHIISSLLITVGILFFIYFLRQNIKNDSDQFVNNHIRQHNEFVSQIQLSINERMAILNEAKFNLANIWESSDLRQKFLLSLHYREDAFKTMLIADDQANIVHSSPVKLLADMKASNTSINISDRDYFQAAINSNQIFVSPGFLGRGFGKDLIVAISVGIPNLDNGQDKQGVLEGSLVLSSLNTFSTAANDGKTHIDAVLLDQDSHVLFASDSLNIRPLGRVTLSPGVNQFYQHGLMSLLVDDHPLNDTIYYAATTQFDWGWQLTTLQDEASFARLVEKTLLYFAVAIVLVVLISELVAWFISESWSYYLTRLNDLIDHESEFATEVNEFEGDMQLPEEIGNLYQEIKRSKLKIIEMNTELQNTVAERTEKLQKANQLLNVMAREDGLTRLANRRVFNDQLNAVWSDSQESMLCMSLLIIDVDHFKKINDSYGHPVGDKVLINLAQELLEFDTDDVLCIARVGGEEFGVIMQGASHQAVLELAEKIRQYIESHAIVVSDKLTVDITVSIGVATIDPATFTASKLYQLADNALYEAKNSGRNCIKSTVMH